ncbi:hypothetical protein EDB82DRAFT_522506 [Fusarium venenatum]|uniref:uncharacterized protein n=1 Tax=Fusarium venenatum TaxID=56646 RepID=UPI001D9ACA63|nr:hypothetical protein EDB82DRAFT_522506 [Fusarium venenatum]
MQLTNFITLTAAFFTAASVAAPAPQATVTIIARDKAIPNSKTTLSIPLGKLTHPSDLSWSTLTLDKLTIKNGQDLQRPPTIDLINCQMYKDKNGVSLETFRFNKATPADVTPSTTQINLSMGWILCYVEGGSVPK